MPLRPLLATFLALGSAPLSPSILAPLPIALHGASPQWIAIEPVRNEDEVQLLARQFDLRGCFQGLALALGDASDLARARTSYPGSRSLGAFAADERLFALTLLPGESLRPVAGLRVLDLQATQALIAVPAPLGVDLCDLVLNRTREPFHDGVIAVPTRRMSPARGSRHAPSPTTRRAPAVADPRVTALVNGVTQANLDADVNYYSNNFHTRRSDQTGGTNAQNDLLARLQALGLAASLHSFDGNADNVIADLPGALEPAKVVIVGAHYDTINYAGPATRAPGADDNGSGTAAVLELARIFAASGQQFRYTVRFCLFSSEEFGLVGSDAYSQDLVNQGVEVIAMLNTDMNAYRDPTDTLDLDFVTNDTTTWLTDDLEQISLLYVPTLPVVKKSLGGGTSDHKSFYYDGYPAAFYFEDVDHYSPYIHGSGDTYGVSANDFVLAELIVKSVAAGLGTYAEPIDMTVVHAPIAGSADSWNPYAARATVTSNTSAAPTSCELQWDAGAGLVVTPMTPTALADEWVGEIAAQPAGTTIRYALLATDSSGNTERLPSLGDFTFQVGQPQRFYFEDFESGATGWTHGSTNDDWQLGTPAGKSTDPNAAYAGTKAYGTDLGGSGFNGEYRANANCYLLSPTIDASAQDHVHLRYARWLGVEDGVYDQAEIRVNGVLQWSNPVGGGSDHLIDDAWSLQNLDVSSIADGNAAVAVRFKMVSDGGLQFGGWNVDDLELYSLAAGTEPELWRDTGYLSLAAGGTSQLQLNLGAGFANRNYVVLAGVSGTAPGFQFGKVHVDLNYDAITQLALGLLPFLPGFLGTLDANGRANATVDLDPGTDPAFAGMTLNLVAVTLAKSDHATTPIAIELVP